MAWVLGVLIATSLSLHFGGGAEALVKRGKSGFYTNTFNSRDSKGYRILI